MPSSLIHRFFPSFLGKKHPYHHALASLLVTSLARFMTETVRESASSLCLYGCMKLFLSHSSALEFWRLPHASSLALPSRTLPHKNDHVDRYEHPVELLQQLDLTAPIHLVVVQKENRIYTKNIVCHTNKHLPSKGEFSRITPELYVSNPELCFLQMSSLLNLIDLIQLGFELCGTYAICNDDPHGFVSRPPVTTRRRIESFLNRTEPVPKIRIARRAIRYVLENSASPMESKLAMLLTLPQYLGGYGIRPPLLNERVELQSQLTNSRSETFITDMLWTKQRFVVEYDSTMFHTGEDRITSDSIRRARLIDAGYTVLSVTKRQVLDLIEFRKTALLIAQETNTRIRAERNDVKKKNILHYCLFNK